MLQKLQFRPGVNREGTTLANEGGWYDCDKIRFRSGYPEKIGGWAAASYNTFLGYCRSLWNWITLKGYNLMGVGTNLKFYIENGGTYYDITPLREINGNTPSAGPPVVNAAVISLSASGTVLTVSDSGAQSLQVDDFVTIAGAGTIGGVDVNGEYQIATVTSGTTYTVTLATPTTGTDSASTITIAYQINTGYPIYTIGTGWGAGPWVPYATSALTGLFATNSGSSTITVTQASHGLTTGQYVYFSAPTATISAGLTTTITVVPNGFTAGQAVQFNTTGLLPTGMSVGTTYYAGLIVSNTFVLYDTQANAIAGGATGKIVTSGVATGTATCNIVSISGIPTTALLKAFQVTVVNSNTYTISTVIGQAPGPVITYTANATASGLGGTVVVSYPSITVVGSTTREWGSGTTTGIGFQLRLWSQSNFGEDLLFNPRGGAIYLWQPKSGATPAYGTRGSVISGTYTPTLVNEIMVSDSTRIVIAFGCNDPSGTYATTTIDPMQIRWTAQESYTDWEPLPTNQAGDYRLSHGSEIIGALQTRQEINIWTDSAIYAMQYLGPPLVWGFTLLADNISIASPNAMATASGVVYWMGTDKFYVYSGRVETLPCAVRTYIYDDINRDQFFQVYAGTNEAYSEVWWFYCSKNSNVIDRYVIFNYLDRVWYYGTMDRTAWLDTSLRDYPIAATGTNLLVYHEAAVDDGSTNPPSAIDAYVQSSDFDIGDGHNYGFVWRMIPDITFDGSNTSGTTTINPEVNFTVRPRQNPGANYGTSNAPTVQSAQNYQTQTVYTVQQFTEIVYTRIRGRQMAFKVESNTLGTQWQLGVPRIDVRPDGRR